MSDLLVPPLGVELPAGLPRGSVPLAVPDAGSDLLGADLLGHEAVENADGSVDLLAPALDPLGAELRQIPWGENLAEHLPDTVLSTLASDVLDGVRADIDSNAEHYETLNEGIAALGLKKERLSEPFEGAAGARSSLVLRAAVRFNASALGELMPAAGPVRTQVLGEAPSGEGGGPGGGIDAASARKQKFLNWYLTAGDDGYYADRDQGLLLLGVLGSTFRCVYRDPVDGKPKSRFRTPFNFIVSAHASDHHGGGRYTEIDRLPPSEVRRLQVLGHWRDVDLAQPTGGEEGDDPAQAMAERSGRRASDRPEDLEHTVYAQRIVCEIAGLEHMGEDGRPTGLPLPWRVVVDADSRTVLRIDRDWEVSDPGLRPRDRFAHERYIPGTGFYGWGFAHLLASSADALTTLLRQGLNANTLVSFPGGFRAKGARVEQNDGPIGPCEWREIDTGGTPIQQALMPLPYRDVPGSFVPLMEMLRSEGEQLGQIAEQQVGEGRQDAPVGTTLALIEQAVRVESAVVKRLHAAQRRELRLLCGLFAEDRGATYPFLVAGAPDVPIAPDFARHDDIVPVSDPNIPTQVQRLAVAQAKLSLAQSAPDLYDLREAHRAILRAGGSDEAEIARLMPEGKRGEPADPVSEFGMAIKGAPLLAAPQQLHQAHLVAHMAQMRMPNLPPPVVSALLAHCGDHLFHLYRAEAALALGVPMLPPPGAPLPPQIEAQIAGRFAQAADAVTAKIAPVLLAGSGESGGEGADLALKGQELALKGRELEMKGRLADDKREEGMRKAHDAARQDQGEMIRQQQALADQSADRALRRDEMAHEERLAGLQVAAQLAKPPPRPPQAPSRAGAPSSGRAGPPTPRGG